MRSNDAKAFLPPTGDTIDVAFGTCRSRGIHTVSPIIFRFSHDLIGRERQVEVDPRSVLSLKFPSSSVPPGLQRSCRNLRRFQLQFGPVAEKIGGGGALDQIFVLWERNGLGPRRYNHKAQIETPETSPALSSYKINQGQAHVNRVFDPLMEVPSSPALLTKFGPQDGRKETRRGG